MRVGFEEFQDQRVKHAISVAETAVDQLVDGLTETLGAEDGAASKLQLSSRRMVGVDLESAQWGLDPACVSVPQVSK